MKKNNATLKILLASLLFGSATLIAAEDSPTTPDVPPTDSTESPAVPSNDTASANKKYVVPTPQATRISALETSLKQRNLAHQIQTLEANGSSFLALYEASLTSSTQGCVIMLHADNEHPDWPDTMAPLRNALPEHSWCTLSIEVPDIIKRAEPVKTNITPQDNSQEELALPNQEIVFARIQATIDKAKSDGVDQFVLLGYKTGASYAVNFLANNPESSEALVLIDIEPTPPISNYGLAQQIKKINQPILDYYMNNNAGSSQFATWRKQSANQRTGSTGNYIQLDALPDRATGKDSKKLLIQRVRGFLKQNTSQITQQKELPEYKKGLFYKSP